MPCSQRKARLLIKEDKAKIYQYNPFTIQLTGATGETIQEVNVGVDTGAKHIGMAITSEDKVLVKGEIELRDDISDNIKTRSALRKARRSRKLRYRPARWMNRKRKQDWLPPSVQSKLNATFMWIDKFCSLIPNPKLHIEVGKFDIHKMINPEVEGTAYQEGNIKGFYDVRYFVFARDKYTCQVCKKKNKILRTHHIVYKNNGGTDRADNLITVCTDCHTSENHKIGGVFHNWMIKGKKVKQYKEATFMNIVRAKTIKRYIDAKITYGSVTTPKRKELDLGKTHYNDAVAISGIELVNANIDEHFHYKQFRKKKRSLHESIPRKGKKEKNITQRRNNKNVKTRNGIYLNDKVDYHGKIGWIYGYSGGEGYLRKNGTRGKAGKDCIVRDIDGELLREEGKVNSFKINLDKFTVLNHNNGWQYAMRYG